MSYAAKKSILTLAVLLMPAAVHGETLYQKDRIQLEGKVRMVTRVSGICRVLAGHHPPDVYEQMKGNDRQPLHVWRLDYAAGRRAGSTGVEADLHIAPEIQATAICVRPRSRCEPVTRQRLEREHRLGPLPEDHEGVSSIVARL